MRVNNILVHICCSVDSHFFLEKLQRDFPQEKLIGFFYDPNIHPYSEYKLRLLDVQRSCKKLGIELIEGEYDFYNWIKTVRGLENEPEKGKRCEVCFDKRFDVSAKKALELNEKSFTTTLLVSPLKSQEQLKNRGEIFYKEHGVKFIAVDYRSNGGTQEQSKVTKKQQLYRQDYCGCMFGLKMQREQQNRLLDELFSSISYKILPSCIDERLEFYKKRVDLEERNIQYKIIKNKFLNYRVFFFKLIEQKTDILDAHLLFYSTLPRKKTQGKVEFTHNNISYMNRDEVKFITLEYFNKLGNFSYNSIKELIFNSPTYQDEIKIRQKLTSNSYDLTPIIIVSKIPQKKVTIEIDSKIYEDTKEELLII